MLRRKQTPSPSTSPPKNEENIPAPDAVAVARKYCPGCTEEIRFELEMCVDCSITATKQNTAKRRERTGRKCKSCGTLLGPERYFNCRSCVKPDDKMAAVNEFYEIAIGGGGRKTVKLT